MLARLRIQDRKSVSNTNRFAIAPDKERRWSDSQLMS
jgi:hypothetical protein